LSLGRGYDHFTAGFGEELLGFGASLYGAGFAPLRSQWDGVGGDGEEEFDLALGGIFASRVEEMREGVECAEGALQGQAESGEATSSPCALGAGA
jgi:hypothetical protein